MAEVAGTEQLDVTNLAAEWGEDGTREGERRTYQ